MEDATRFPDGQLLQEFARTREDQVFEQIIVRHGPMVLNSCLRALGDKHQAEDAAQAVFLLLVQKAASLNPKTVLAGWLYRTTLHVCRYAKRSEVHRQRREQKSAELRKEECVLHLDALALKAEMDAHINDALERLPESERTAIILRYLEGRSEKDAACEVGCPIGTISNRTSRGLERMRRRLGVLMDARIGARRAVVLPLAALCAQLSYKTSQTEALLPHFVASLRRVCLNNDKAPATVLKLAEGAIKTMLWMKAKSILGEIAIVLVCIGIPAATFLHASEIPQSTLALASVDAKPAIPAQQTYGEFKSMNGVLETRSYDISPIIKDSRNMLSPVEVRSWVKEHIRSDTWDERHGVSITVNGNKLIVVNEKYIHPMIENTFATMHKFFKSVRDVELQGRPKLPLKPSKVPIATLSLGDDLELVFEYGNDLDKLLPMDILAKLFHDRIFSAEFSDPSTSITGGDVCLIIVQHTKVLAAIQDQLDQFRIHYQDNMIPQQLPARTEAGQSASLFRFYNISHLPNSEKMADWIRTTVQSDSWDPALGTSIETIKGWLLVVNRPSVHELIEAKLNQLWKK